jgi:hypothetical protein
MAKANNKFQLHIDIRNRDVDLVHRELNTRVHGYETSDFCVQVEVGLQLLDSKFDASDVQFRDIEVHIRYC